MEVVNGIQMQYTNCLLYHWIHVNETSFMMFAYVKSQKKIWLDTEQATSYYPISKQMKKKLNDTLVLMG